MKKHIFLFVLLCISGGYSVLAQTDLPDFGFYSAEELAVTDCPFDKEAEAVVLLDQAVSTYNDDYQLITERVIRIKILNPRGIERGNIRIRFYSKNNFENIGKIQATSYNQGDNTRVSNVDRKSIYTERENDLFSSIKFAIPNVKAGTIIEYRYVSTMKHYGGLDNWIFQSDIPTLKSSYLLQIIPNAEFSYVVSKKFNYPVIIKPDGEGRVYFEMNQIPALRFEPYMDAPKDYLQRVEFQLSGYRNVFGNQVAVNTGWKEIAYSLATDEYLGGTLKKSLPITDELSMLVAKEATMTGKINAVYAYVKNNYGWNGYHGKYAQEGLKKVLERKTGSAGELNLLLINFLQSFKIEAQPLLVAERDFGKVNPAYPIIDRFNKTVAFVEADGAQMILDATQKYYPATLIPYPLLNTYALIINKKTDKLVNIGSNNEAYQSTISLKAVLDKNGLLKGTCNISSSGYAKQSQIAGITENKPKFISKNYEEPHEGLKVDSFYYEYAKTDTMPSFQRINFQNQLSETGGFVLFNYNLFTGLTRNPFTATERFTNVNFGYPYNVTVEQNIELPEGSKTDELPRDKAFENTDKKISLSRVVRRAGNSLTIKIIFKQNITLVPADSYSWLKTFYKSMVDMLNEPLVIKF